MYDYDPRMLVYLKHLRNKALWSILHYVGYCF